MRRKGIILDRDGTLIDFHRDPELGAVVSAFHPDQIRLLPGVIEGLRLLESAGYLLAIATNQPGAAKGQVPLSAIERTNRALCDRLGEAGLSIAAFAVCLHHPEGGPSGDPDLIRACDCRKPAPGMLCTIVADLDLDPGATWMIGDTDADIVAAERAGVRAALVFDERRCELCPLRGREGAPIRVDQKAQRLDLLARYIVDADG